MKTAVFPQFCRQLSLITALFIFGACNEINPQGASEIFANGELPPSLFATANPVPLVSHEQVHEIATHPKLKVAVIDNGVDYNHPFLRDKIAYRLEGEKITGAGYDVLGEDDWSHPNLIDATVFAFGAQLTADHKILEPLPKIFETMDSLNQLFLKRFLPALHADPVLKNSLFRKLNENNFNFLAAFEYSRRQDQFLKNFQEAQEAKQLFDEGQKNVLLKSQPRLRSFFEQEWEASEDQMLLDPMVANLVQFDQFLNLVSQQFAEFEAATRFTENYFNPYCIFFADKKEGKCQLGRRTNTVTIDAVVSLYAQWSRSQSQKRVYDPALPLLNLVCNALPRNEQNEVKWMTPFLRESFFQQKAEEIFRHLSVYSEVISKNSDLTSTENKTLQQTLHSKDAYRRWVLSNLRERSIGRYLCDPERFKLEAYPFSAAYADYANRTHLPFLDPLSTENSHGTHVAGIILSQAPEAAIFPIRILTENRLISKNTNAEKQNQAKQEFLSWLHASHLSDAVKAYVYRATGHDYTKNEIITSVQADFSNLYSENRMSWIFFDQLKTAIAKAGESESKVVNVSLGDDYVRKVTVDSVDGEAALAEALRGLAFEFQKYKIAESMINQAPHSLFVVAAGNKGGWYDGKSKSAIPCDLSSPFFDHFGTMPSRKIKNLICIGSSDGEGEISSFTNIIFAPGVPYLLANGEKITSALKTEDCSGVKAAALRDLGYAPNFLLAESTDSSPELRSYFLTNQYMEPGTNSTSLKVPKEKIRQEQVILEQLLAVATTHQCIARGYVSSKDSSGTSMASAVASGIIAKYITEKAARLGIVADTVYEHPDFEPNLLISEIMSLAESYGGNSALKTMRVLRGINTYPGPRLPDLQTNDSTSR